MLFYSVLTCNFYETGSFAQAVDLVGSLRQNQDFDAPVKKSKP